MNGKWTFSDIEMEWVHDLFETKEEAIEEGKKWYDERFLVGQLEGDSLVRGYKIINVEGINAHD
jgi:hypothetical protein